ncbi:MAG: BMP family ABC transporter substrate-binding protein [Clostridiales bacterium]|nr:BMP family ABC transporter substrate-binding protein [Clostridiales bacterium]
MKKRVLSVLLAGVMTLSMAACVSKPGEGADSGSESSGGYELALVTDVGTIDDKSFNQGSWEGLEAYAKDNDITCKYYKPAEKSDEACLTSIDLAIKGGAKVVVTPGFLFERPILEAQKKYPDVNFIIVDAAPSDGEGNVTIEKNTASIFYAEEQAGYLAGYAAVTEGYTKLGFMGGIAVPAVVRYGYGFIQGADAAAKDLGLAAGDVSVKYTYVGNFDATPENNAKAAAWYNEGTEVIFACGGAVGNSVMKAAETAGKYVIGVDVDQSSESDTVITSAMKNLGTSVYDAVASYYDGNFAGGKSVTLTAAEDGIMLPMETSKFKVFTQEKYDELYAGLKDGSIDVLNDADIQAAAEADDTLAGDETSVPTEIVKVESIK